jgi:hypothetical protein
MPPGKDEEEVYVIAFGTSINIVVVFTTTTLTFYV